jgi:SOS response regulatory protein OraA/RecX
LWKYTEEWKSILTENFLERKIIQLKNKNKSKQYIKNKLIEQPEDREIVDKILSEVFWELWDNEALTYEYNKLYRKNLDERKIIQRLLSKWFKYDEIKKLH